MNTRAETWIADTDAVRTRLDQFLAACLPGESRSQVQNWIRKGYVRVNGNSAKTGHSLKLGDRIELSLPDTVPDQPFPEAIPLEILYQDADLAVINKPAGLVCHTGAGVRSGTLVNALLHWMGPIETGDPVRPGIVHRLDKFTSGVMLIAKNSLAHRRLAQQFKDREVKKEYLALVHGVPRPPSGTIDLPLGRDPQNRKKISTRARRKRNAITHYKVIEDCRSVALLSIRIETGRTHQIRVHLSQKGHPVVGDSLYGANRWRSLPADLAKAAQELHRPFLHSHKLEFRHPVSGERMIFESGLPRELEQFMEAVRNRYP